MLKLKSADSVEPVEIGVPLGGGAMLYVRPAETFEHMMAAHKATELLAALLTGGDALIQIKSALGQRFDGADFTDVNWQDAAARFVTLLELTAICATRWEGVADENGTVIEKPERSYLALLLRDSEIANRVGAAVRRKVSFEADEGNGSAASPSGAAANPDTAATASGLDSPAAVA